MSGFDPALMAAEAAPVKPGPNRQAAAISALNLDARATSQTWIWYSE
jgi:hypothetical protein